MFIFMNRKEIVIGEIEEYKRKIGDSWRDHYFNNWYGHLTSKAPKGRCFLTSRYSRPDEKNGKMVGFDYLPPEDRPGDFKANQTMREFYATIDKVLEDEQIDVQELEKRLFDEDGRVIWENMNDVLDTALPAFIKLREMGYTRRDLTA